MRKKETMCALETLIMKRYSDYVPKISETKMIAAAAEAEPLRYTRRPPSVSSLPCEVSVAGGAGVQHASVAMITSSSKSYTAKLWYFSSRDEVSRMYLELKGKRLMMSTNEGVHANKKPEKSGVIQTDA